MLTITSTSVLTATELHSM